MAELTRLMAAAEAGDRQAAADLFALAYDDLRQLAAQHLSRESPGQTLQPTALVHEAYLRLLGPPASGIPGAGLTGAGRGQFFAAASLAMRHILIEWARRKKSQKRGGGRLREPIDLDQVAAPERTDELLALDEALTALAAVEPKIAELVTLRYFGGLTLKDAADALGIPPRTADAHWAYARAWLLAEMRRGDGAAS